MSRGRQASEQYRTSFAERIVYFFHEPWEFHEMRGDLPEEITSSWQQRQLTTSAVVFAAMFVIALALIAGVAWGLF